MPNQWDEFASSFDQAAVKAPAKIDPLAPLPFSPSQRYIDKNLAPEQTLTYGDVGELGHAAKTAVKMGVLPKEVADHMLPMAMVEGRPGNFGVNDGNGFRATARILKNAKALGLGITDMTDPTTAERFKFDSFQDSMDPANPGRTYYRNFTFQGPNGPSQGERVVDGPPQTPLTIDYPREEYKGGYTSFSGGIPSAPPPQQALKVPATAQNKHVMIQGSGGPGDMAAVMALILAEKHAVANGDVAGTIKGYNGSGAATDLYLKKVLAAKGLLAHPRNAPLMHHYNQSYLGD